MQSYLHEQYRERDKTIPDNTVWPLMSTDGLDDTDMTRYLQARDLSSQLAEDNSWYPSRHANDNFLRIVIPALTTKEGHVYWQARAVSSNVHLRYQSPKGPRHGALIRVLSFPAHKPTREVVIVEGPMDALAAAQCGADSIALMGMAPGDQAIEHLIKLVAKRSVLIVLDNEPEAQSAAGKIAMALASAGSKAHVDKLRYVKDLAAMNFITRSAWLDTHLDGLT